MLFSYLKGELYKMNRRKTFFKYSLLVIVFETILHYIYYKDNLGVIDYYSSFASEYYYLYLILGLFFASDLLISDIYNGYYRFLNKLSFVLSKFIIYAVFLLFIMLFSAFSSFVVSLLFFNKIVRYTYLTSVIKAVSSQFFSVLFLGYLIFFLNVFINSSPLCMGGSYIFLLLADLINNYILNKKLKSLYFLPSLYLKFVFGYNVKSVIILVLYSVFFYFVVVYRLKKRCIYRYSGKMK